MRDPLARAELCQSDGDLTTAEELCRQALLRSAGDSRAAHLLATILCEAGRFPDAISLLEQTLPLIPDSGVLWNDLGALQWKVAGAEAALPCFERASALEPDEPFLGLNYGRCLLAVARHEEGLAILLSLPPDILDVDAELAIALSNLETWRLRAAINGFERVLRQDAGRAEARRGIVASYWNLGDAERAIENARLAVHADPDPAIHAQYLRILHFAADLDAATIAAEHRRAAERWFPERPAARPARLPRGRLRVAYLSGLFLPHRTTFDAILYARERVECVCLSDGALPDGAFGTMERIDTSGLSNEAVAALVRKLGVHILVECDGYFRGGVRLPVFAARPAPVQLAISCFYPASTGLGQIQFRITDEVLDPPGAEADPAERLLRIPHVFCYRPDHDGTPVTPLPALGSGEITFGSCSIAAKINERTADCWAAILRAVPAANLLFHHSLDRSGSREVNPDIRQRIEGLFADRGVRPERIRLVGWRPHGEHLRVYDAIDIALDPFPYNGALTTLNALYMGVPVISLEGRTTAGRVGQALLGAVGLHRLVATSPVDYIRIAVGLAGDLAALSELRARLRPDFLSSPLTDRKSFALALENAYHIAWKERNCRCL